MEWRRVIAEVPVVRPMGRVRRVVGLTIEAEGPRAEVGELCDLVVGDLRLPAEVVGFRDARVLLMPLGTPEGLRPGTPVVARRRRLVYPAGPGLLGRVVDALARPLDGRGPLRPVTWREFRRTPIDPLERQPVTRPFPTGVRVLDALVTLGEGQRIGVFAGSGSGKSTLLGMLARSSAADVNVVLLVGERGREVREFLEHDLGTGGLARSVVVVAQADQPPLLRVKAAQLGVAMALAFAREGRRVLLLMDSLTRYAMALREVGLGAGEPPAARSYPPSVFAELPVFVEQAGNVGAGSVTAVYTVLVEGDDLDEPLADTARSLLDGHVVLSRRLLTEGHYPPVDPLASLSRVRRRVLDDADVAVADRVRRALALLEESRELRQLGLYRPGGRPELDGVLAHEAALGDFLRQDAAATAAWPDTWQALRALAGRLPA